MNDILYTLFQDNVELPGKIYDFCKKTRNFVRQSRNLRPKATLSRKNWGGSYTLILKTSSPGTWRNWSMPIISSDWACVKR